MNRRSALGHLATGIAIVAAPRATAAAEPLRVVTIPVETGAQAYYALDLGFFKNAGIDVDVTAMSNGAVIASAVSSGSMQIGLVNTMAMATARGRGLPFVYIAGAGEYRSAAPTSALVVATNSPLRTAADLNGKTIGVLSLRGVDQTAVESWLDQNGGDSSKVHFLEVGTATMAAALDRGTIDAAEIAEPALSAARASVRVLGKANDGIAKRFLIAGWFANADWVAKNADVARKFAAVMQQTAVWADAEANRAQAAAILEKYTKIRTNSPGYAHMSYARTLDPQSIAPVIDAGVKYKVLDKTIPASDLIAEPFRTK